MIAYLFIFLGAALRVIPHPGNFAPIAAIALFGAVYLNKKYALILPLAAMAVSDFFIGFDSLQSRAIVYGSFLLIGGIGYWLRNHKSVWTVVGASLVSSVIFFLISNLPFVHAQSLYPYTWAGTMTSYMNGLPFFRNTLLGDLFYTTTFFGAYELIRAWKAGKLKLHAHPSQSSN
jgi:hypothetical protein